MARRKNRRRSTKKKGVNILSLAEAGLMINAVSNGLFGQGMVGFLFPKMGVNPVLSSGHPYRASSYSGQPVYSGGTEVSFSEFWLNTTGQSAIDQVKENFKSNWVSMGIQMVAIPVGFRVGKSLAQPALTQTRKLLKQVKLDKVVTV